VQVRRCGVRGRRRRRRRRPRAVLEPLALIHRPCERGDPSDQTYSTLLARMYTDCARALGPRVHPCSLPPPLAR
jgi:hypothetical protein